MLKSFNVSEIIYLQTPFEAVFGIFDSETKSSQFVANLVAGSPILVALSLETHIQQHIHGTLVGVEEFRS